MADTSAALDTAILALAQVVATNERELREIRDKLNKGNKSVEKRPDAAVIDALLDALADWKRETQFFLAYAQPLASADLTVGARVVARTEMGLQREEGGFTRIRAGTRGEIVHVTDDVVGIQFDGHKAWGSCPLPAALNVLAKPAGAE
ncbi:MAG TPA: hypothetical protein VJS69_01250 [Candidatus Krumholzibacteria bacterium]|nr:hypothetical protein [Candidatus Krumholzibacteria bacterium]